MSNRNHLIELLRVIAAVWVALFHINGIVAFQDNWYFNIVYKGHIGVPIFFVISGYCIYYAAHHAKTAFGFIIRRLFRIFPAYWFSLVVVVICLIGFKLIHGDNPVPLPRTVYSFLATIGLFTNPVSNVRVINYVYWTLSYELCFYTLVFIGLLFPTMYRLLWLIVISIATIFLPKHDHWVFFFIQCWPYFCLGMVVFRLLHCVKEYFYLNLLLLILSIVGFFYTKQPTINIITGIITATLITINHFKPLKSTILSAFGNYSYSIYLIHVPVAVYLLGPVKQLSYVQAHLWLNILVDIALVTVVILLSRWIYLYIELPAIKAGKKLADHSEKSLKLTTHLP
jgi:peptidoglycan/LPS O-acetylase OafA/YrhL